MQDPVNLMTDEDRNTWTRKTLERAVKELTAKGLFEGIVVEAKPAWSFPGQIMIGKIRGQGNQARFYWFIAGNLPTDCIASSTALTARDAARHFSLKWQLEAGKQGAGGEELARQAEGLYELADEPALWDEATG